MLKVRTFLYAMKAATSTDTQDENKTSNDQPEPVPSTLQITDMLYNEFQDFERHVIDAMACIKFPPKKEPGNTAKSYEKALIRSLKL